MEFENNVVAVDSLPAIEKVNFTPLEKDYLYFRLTTRVIFFIILAGGLVALSIFTEVPAWQYFTAWGLLLLLSIFFEIAAFGVKGYALREKDVSYKSGLIVFRTTSVPFNRIQHCEINQGPLARLFDLAAVKVYTAGGSSSDLSISGLHKDQAVQLRDHITRLTAEHE